MDSRTEKFMKLMVVWENIENYIMKFYIGKEKERKFLIKLMI